MNNYQKPAELYDGLRLHQNENTGGCSPRVIEALAALRPEEIGFYPPYSAAIDACARHLGVSADSVALVNGLDEGITGIAIACLRSLGVPARYVSGYLRTRPPEGRPRLVGADASHAWFSV